MNRHNIILIALALIGFVTSLSAQQEVKPREVIAADNPVQRNNSNIVVYQPLTKGGELVQQEQVYIQVDKAAEYPGGHEALNSYFKDRAEASPATTPAKTLVSFTVEKDGSISDVVLVRSSLAPAENTSLLQKVREMPTWQPALINDLPVRSRVSLPIPAAR